MPQSTNNQINELEFWDDLLSYDFDDMEFFKVREEEIFKKPEGRAPIRKYSQKPRSMSHEEWEERQAVIQANKDMREERMERLRKVAKFNAPEDFKPESSLASDYYTLMVKLGVY